jgi:hypothetical protein
MKKFRYGARRDGAAWQWITWPNNIVHTDAVEGLLAQAKEIPGVKVFPGGVNFCRTALGVDTLQKLFEATGTTNLIKPPPAFPVMPWDGLYEHQNAAVTHMLSNGGRGLLADPPGFGKTRVAITNAQHWRRRYDEQRPAIILAKKYLRQTWFKELRACGVDTDPEAGQVCVLESRDIDDKSFTAGAHWYFVNPEIVRTWWPRLLLERPAVALIDEAHHYKDIRTNRGKGAQMVATVPHVLFLTGTPMPDRPQDLWSLLTMINGSGAWGTAVDFIQRYAGAIYNGYGYVPQMATNGEELLERMRPWYLRRTLEEAGFDLPAFSRNVIEASWEDARMGVQTKRTHERIMKDNMAMIAKALREGTLDERVLTVLSQLRVQTSMAKVPTTVELVQELRAAGESVVVFTWTVDAANAIAKGLETTRNEVDFLESPAVTQVCTGEVSQAKRDASVAYFQEHGGVIVATYATLSEGVTLTKARFVVLHDLDWTPSTIEQAEKRVHRISQNRACVSHWVILRDSADELFARVLEFKLLMNSELIGNHNAELMVTAAQVSRMRSFDEEFEESMRKWRNGVAS